MRSTVAVIAHFPLLTALSSVLLSCTAGRAFNAKISEEWSKVAGNLVNELDGSFVDCGVMVVSGEDNVGFKVYKKGPSYEKKGTIVSTFFEAASTKCHKGEFRDPSGGKKRIWHEKSLPTKVHARGAVKNGERLSLRHHVGLPFPCFSSASSNFPHHFP